MPTKRKIPGGFEYIDTPIEKEFKKKFKDKKKSADLSSSDIKELVFLIARKLHLIK